MIEKQANIWSPEFDNCWRVIPINCQINSKGEAIMGAGLAKEAKERYPDLALDWGGTMRFYENHGVKPSLLESAEFLLLGLPTKGHWREKSDSIMIEEGLKSLSNVAKNRKLKIVCPRLGCGERTGRLDWERDVRPLMLRYFEHEDNLIVVSFN